MRKLKLRPHARNWKELRLYWDFGQDLSRTVELGLECGQMSAGDPYCAENTADSQSLPMDIIQPRPFSLSFLLQPPSIILLNSPSPHPIFITLSSLSHLHYSPTHCHLSVHLSFPISFLQPHGINGLYKIHNFLYPLLPLLLHFPHRFPSTRFKLMTQTILFFLSFFFHALVKYTTIS